jgi:hypothetical protein
MYIISCYKFCLCVKKTIQTRQLEFLYTCRHFVALTSKFVAMRMDSDGLVLEDSRIISSNVCSRGYCRKTPKLGSVLTSRRRLRISVIWVGKSPLHGLQDCVAIHKCPTNLDCILTHVYNRRGRETSSVPIDQFVSYRSRSPGSCYKYL